MFPNLPAWLKALNQGTPTAAPAEGVYGYTANPFNEEALATLLEIKKRSPSKGFIILISNISELKHFCPKLPKEHQEAVEKFWHPNQPPTTLILSTHNTLSKTLSGAYTGIAIRLAHTAYMQEYLKAWGGPLVSTSLNLSGELPATSAAQIPPGTTALTLPSPLSGTPSRIFNPQTNTWLR